MAKYNQTDLDKLIEEEQAKRERIQEAIKSDEPSGIFAALAGFFESQFSKVWYTFTHHIKVLFAWLVGDFVGWFGKIEGALWDTLTGFLMERGLMDETSARDLQQLKAIHFPFNIIVFMLVLVGSLTTYVKYLLYATSGDIRRKAAATYNPENPSMEQIIGAAFIAPEKTTEIRQILLENGYSEKQIDLFFIAMYRLYSVDEIRTLYLRGVLDEAKMYERMREHGFTDTRISELVQSWEVIPTIQDLLFMVAKEAFEPDIIEHYGYADEFPESQVQWANKQGISRDWMLKYWYAHWDTPSIQHGFSMLQREDVDNKGHKIINEQELDDLFRTIEIPPFWRDKLKKIAYLPYTRVDVRRMHQIGVLTDEQLVVAYEDLGFDYEHAVNMAKFTILYNQQTEKDLTKGEILKGYAEDLITESDAITLLVDMRYSEAEAEYLVAYEAYKKTVQQQKVLVDNVRLRYQYNWISLAEARDKLGKLGVHPDLIEVTMQKWETEHRIDVTRPSRLDLAKMFKLKIVNKDEYREEMRRKGYSEKYIDWYEKLDLKA